jgi:hypothetical protein
MKKSVLYLVAFILIFTACTSSGMTEEEKFAAAQQTLDAAVSQNDGSSASGSSVQVEPTKTDVPVMTPQLLESDEDEDQQPGDADPTATSGLSRSNDLGDTRIIEFDNDGPLWDSNCNTLRQPMAEFGEGWLEDDHLFGAGLNCDLGFDLKISQSGIYEVILVATYAPDFGQLRLSFTRGSTDDFIFNISLYDPDVRPTGDIPLGQWHFDANEKNHFILVVYDKPDASLDYKFGLDYLKLVLVQPDS